MSTRGARLDYLAALVRQDIRRHQKSIDEFKPRPEQSEEEAQDVLGQFRKAQLFRREVAEELRRQIEGEK